ncbi:MAG: hypothetical protein CL694_03245 [Chloroflexi bacterium]|nr:hypothetical protein [Chloroflexota bacterium]
MPKFIPGLELSRLFYKEAVKPVLDSHFSELSYSAARLGPSSDVLGYDTVRSTDHSWGPRLQLFVAESDFAEYSQQISAALARSLPVEFHGYPTSFTKIEGENSRLLTPVTSGPVSHWVEILTVRSFFDEMLSVDPFGPISATDWVTFSGQSLLSVTRGAVYSDSPADLAAVRQRFEYYPNDVWLYLLAAQWTRIGQEEPFMARCAEAGDHLGSRLVAAHLVQDVMRLCFLMEKRYAPYSKWFGTAFRELALSRALSPSLDAVLASGDWEVRQRHLSDAYEFVARAHNELGVTEDLDPVVASFHDRPYDVIGGDRFAAAIRSQIRDQEVLALTPDIGSVDQFSNSTDILSHPDRRRRLSAVY